MYWVKKWMIPELQRQLVCIILNKIFLFYITTIFWSKMTYFWPKMPKIKGTVSNHHQIGGEKSIKADDKKPPRLTFRCRSDENIFTLTLP